MDFGGLIFIFSLFPVALSILDREKRLEKIELHNLDWIARPLAKNVLCSSPVY